MQIIHVSAPGLDIATVQQINRFTDGEYYYVIENEADYQNLPAHIQAAIGPDNLANIIAGAI